MTKYGWFEGPDYYLIPAYLFWGFDHQHEYIGILESRKKLLWFIMFKEEEEHYWASTASVETFKKVQYSTTNMNHECDFYLTGKQ